MGNVWYRKRKLTFGRKYGLWLHLLSYPVIPHLLGKWINPSATAGVWRQLAYAQRLSTAHLGKAASWHQMKQLWPVEVWSSHQLQWGKLTEAEDVLWASQHIWEEKGNALPKPFWERLTGELRWHYQKPIILWMQLKLQERWGPGRLWDGSRRSVHLGCLPHSCNSPGLGVSHPSQPICWKTYN